MSGVGISFHSITSAVLFFDIGVFLIAIIRRNKFFLKDSIWCLFLFAVLLIIRVLLPLDIEAAIVINSCTVPAEVVNTLPYSALKIIEED